MDRIPLVIKANSGFLAFRYGNGVGPLTGQTSGEVGLNMAVK